MTVPYHATEASGVSQDTQVLLHWLDKEVRWRLDSLDRKLDAALAKHAAPGGHARSISGLDVAVTGGASASGTSSGEAGSAEAAGSGILEAECYDVDEQGLKLNLASHKEPDELPTAPGGSSSEQIDVDAFQSRTFSSFLGPALPDQSSTSRPLVRKRRTRMTTSGNAEVDAAREEFVKSHARASALDEVWKIMDDPDSGLLARVWERSMCCLILASIVMAVISTEDLVWKGAAASGAEGLFECIFAAEITVRFMATPNRGRFFFNAYNVVDSLSGLPIILRAVTGFSSTQGYATCDIACVVIRSVVPALRLAKLLRHFQQFHLLLKAFYIAFEALPVMIYIYLLIMMCFSAAIYIVEPRDNIETFSRAWWLAIISMTTIGYGDVYPQTDLGRYVVGVFVFISSMYMAIPLGIIGNAFNDVWKDRHRILLMRKVKIKLMQAGYTAAEIPKVFDLFDLNFDGQLDFNEFRLMVQGMHLGLDQGRVVELYKIFDEDRSGGIDPAEFLQALFPETFCALIEDDDFDDDFTDSEDDRPEDVRKERSLGEDLDTFIPSRRVAGLSGISSNTAGGDAYTLSASVLATRSRPCASPAQRVIKILARRAQASGTQDENMARLAMERSTIFGIESTAVPRLRKGNTQGFEADGLKKGRSIEQNSSEGSGVAA